MNIDDAIRGRRSIGRVTDAPVPREVVERLLEAATWAPNYKLTQPWRFTVFTGEARRGLGEAHADAVAAGGGNAAPEARAAQVALTFRAPVIIACVCQPSADDPVTIREDRDAVSAAIQNLLLAAHAEGLGAIWRSGLFCDEPQVREHLGMSPADMAVGFVYLGWPDEAPEPADRLPVQRVTRWLGW